jgi:hypothetical protein
VGWEHVPVSGAGRNSVPSEADSGLLTSARTLGVGTVLMGAPPWRRHRPPECVLLPGGRLAEIARMLGEGELTRAETQIARRRATTRLERAEAEMGVTRLPVCSRPLTDPRSCRCR